MRTCSRTGATALILTLLLMGCDSSPTDPSAEEATVSGTVVTEPSGSPQQTAATRLARVALEGEAHTVAIGEVNSNGAFQAAAEADVDVSGNFRIEGVPAGRTELMAVAYGEGGAEVGRAVLHERTEAGAEHRLHPIDARSTLHGEVWTQARASAGGGGEEISSAEMALFLHADAATTQSLAGSASAIGALASAAADAGAAMTATLAAEGHAGLDASARGQLLADLAAERDRARDDGADATATQRAFASAALDLYADEGVSMETIALASATAATALDAGAEAGGGGARLAAAKEAILLNLEARQRAVAEVEGDALSVKAGVLGELDEAYASVEGATSISAVVSAVTDWRVEAEADLLSLGLDGLLELPGEIVGGGEAEARLQAAVAAARLWARLEAAGSVEEMVTATADVRLAVEAATDAFVEALPSEAQQQVSAEVLTQLLLAFGAGPDCG